MKDLRLLVAHGVRLERNRWLHRGERNQLQQMIRHHVSQRARLLVISAALLDPDFLGGGDLHTIDVTAVPDRLKNSVTESKDENVLNGFLSQIMIDSINLIFLQYTLKVAVQFLR